MDRTLGGVQIQNDPLGVVERFRLPDQLSVQRHQPQQVLFARQHLRLEAVQRRGQGRTAIPDLLRTDQPKRRIDRNPLGVVEVLVAGESAVNRLPQQISERELLVCALPGVAEMLVNQFSETEPFVQFANQNQAPSEVTCDPWKSTLRSPLKLSWNGLVCFSPIGCWPPWRPHRALAPMNKDAQGRWKVGMSNIN